MGRACEGENFSQKKKTKQIFFPLKISWRKVWVSLEKKKQKKFDFFESAKVLQAL